MKQRLFEKVAAASCAAVLVTSACGGKVTILGGTTEGAGGVTSTTSTSDPTSTSSTSSVGAGPTTTTDGWGGYGAGGSCLGCADYINSADATIEEVCGYTGDGCEPDSSCATLVALGDCVCGPNGDGTGKCAGECPISCGIDPNGDDSGCQTCALNECGTEAQACLNDVGQ